MLLSDYQEFVKDEITGVDKEVFNNSNARDYLLVICSCGERFQTRRQDLAARFKRGNNIQCTSCVATKNGKLGGYKKQKRD